jgi:dimethylargininase
VVMAGGGHSMVRSEGDRLRRVVVCSPRSEYYRVDDCSAHNISEPANALVAMEQHSRLISTLVEAGAEVIDVPELPRHPNSVFTRDSSLCTPRGYIRLRMGLDTRRGEGDWMSEHLEAHRVPFAGAIREPGTVEGGDVILAGSVAFVGQSERTNLGGVQQLSGLLEEMGYEVRVAHIVPPRLHIGGAMSMVGPDRVLHCADVFPRGFFDGFRTVEVPPETFVSANVICLGPDEVVVEKTNRIALRALETAGVVVHTLVLSEFIKGSGGPTCLILPVDRRG